jgi:pyridoxal 5'-phosphate synthase pdxS subunit
MLKGGLIMDVTNVEQASYRRKGRSSCSYGFGKSAGRYQETGGVARMSDPKMIKEIKKAVSIQSWPK